MSLSNESAARLYAEVQLIEQRVQALEASIERLLALPQIAKLMEAAK
jgi:prefoldin subunit 5